MVRPWLELTGTTITSFGDSYYDEEVNGWWWKWGESVCFHSKESESSGDNLSFLLSSAGVRPRQEWRLKTGSNLKTRALKAGWLWGHKIWATSVAEMGAIPSFFPFLERSWLLRKPCHGWNILHWRQLIIEQSSPQVSTTDAGSFHHRWVKQTQFGSWYQTNTFE